MFTLLGLLVVGLIAGALARLLVPGRDPLGCLGTMALGIAGSFVGGLLGSLIFDGDLELRRSHSFLGSVVGAIVTLLLIRRFAPRVGRR